jgi:hypothetical protein
MAMKHPGIRYGRLFYGSMGRKKQAGLPSSGLLKIFLRITSSFFRKRKIRNPGGMSQNFSVRSCNLIQNQAID